MSILVKYTPGHMSISEFMYYLAVRYDKKNPLTAWESANLYKVYIDFCEQKGINYISRIGFLRLVKQYGIRTERMYVSGQGGKTGKTRTVIIVDEEELFRSLGMFSRPVDITEHISYVYIDGVKYRLTMNFEKIAELPTVTKKEDSDPTEDSE